MAAVAVDPAAVLPAAATFFRTRGHGFGIWTRGHADAALDAVLPDAGFEIAIEMPVMVLDTMPAERPAPPGAVVGPVVDEATAADFRSVALDGFAEDEGNGLPSNRSSAIRPVFANRRSPRSSPASTAGRWRRP